MKYGNVSETIVQTPNFFTSKRNKIIEIFKTDNNGNIKRCKKRDNTYFRSRDYTSTFFKINTNNNPLKTIERSDSNEQKYIPIYQREKLENNAEAKKTYFPHISNSVEINKNSIPSKKNSFKNFTSFVKNTNIHNIIDKDLRQEIMENTKNLLSRLNVTYDLNQWNKFDQRSTMNHEIQTAYSPIFDSIKGSFSPKDEYIKTMKNKSLGLKTITQTSKSYIKNHIIYKQNKQNSGISKKRAIFGIMKNSSSLDVLLNNNKDNLLQLQKNNRDPQEYSKEDQKFIKENTIITEKINNNKKGLYKYFPSKTRMEFEVKKIFPVRKLLKLNTNDWGFIDIDKYRCKKENFSGVNQMWNRKLHKDCYKLN